MLPLVAGGIGGRAVVRRDTDHAASFSGLGLYDFTASTVLYYYPDPSNPWRDNTNGYRFDTGATIVKESSLV